MWKDLLPCADTAAGSPSKMRRASAGWYWSPRSCHWRSFRCQRCSEGHWSHTSSSGKWQGYYTRICDAQGLFAINGSCGPDCWARVKCGFYSAVSAQLSPNAPCHSNRYDSLLVALWRSRHSCESASMPQVGTNVRLSPAHLESSPHRDRLCAGYWSTKKARWT